MRLLEQPPRVACNTVFQGGLTALLLLCLAVPAAGQSQLFPVSLPALEVTPSGTYLPDQGAYLSTLTYLRLASPEELDPSTRGTGRVETVILAAGVRGSDSTAAAFRWRAALIDMDLIRTPLSMGLTLFDFNRAGWLDTDFRWVNLRIGPSFFIGSPESFFALRAIGSAGLTSVQPGRFLYDGLGSDVQVRRRGYELGYAGHAHLQFQGRYALQAQFGYRTMLGGERPQFYRATGSLGARITPFLFAHLTYTIEEARVRRLRRQHTGFGLSLSGVF